MDLIYTVVAVALYIFIGIITVVLMAKYFGDEVIENPFGTITVIAIWPLVVIMFGLVGASNWLGKVIKKVI